MKFPFILKARDPLILSSERVGEGGGRRYLAIAGPFATIEQARGFVRRTRGLSWSMCSEYFR